MADEIDIANDLIDGEVARALNKIRKDHAQNLKGAKYCEECGDDIPEGRQKLGFSLCVPCAQESERRKSLFID
ncbi:MAG: hypothetical protein A3F12_03885 [Gammaproteobacteria bacterium RIFCSPHIGHO2_12_FULL_38_14]|nr:MAG: hypothetical protein A3F12_03885 [Gammaproteobacteria bacterium RIFCSPHIGHO2_12_FULL_38_14]